MAISSFQTSNYFQCLHEKNVKYNDNIRGKVNQKYNQLLSKYNLQDHKIPGDNLEELGLNQNIKISRIDLYFKAYQKILSKYETNVEIKLTTGDFYEPLHGENVKYSANVRGLVYQKYNQLIKNCGSSEPLIPGDNDLETLGMNRITTIARTDLFFKAYKDTLFLFEKQLIGKLRPVSLQDPSSHSPIVVPSSGIKNGYGNYVAFYKGTDGLRGLSFEEYQKVYEVFHSNSDLKTLNYSDSRHALLAEKIQKIDQNIHITFVPKTLYELAFVHQCIKEDFERGSICDLSTKSYSYGVRKMTPEDKNCWHSCCLFSSMMENKKEMADELLSLSYRMNEIMVKKLVPRQEGLTFEELALATEKELHYLERLSKKEMPTYLFEGKKNIRESLTANLWLNDGYNFLNPKRPQVLRSAMTLECSQKAQNALILYRAEDPGKRINKKEKINPSYSTSLSSSILSGILYDKTASTIYYCGGKWSGPNGFNTYAIILPKNEVNSSIFHIPSDNSIAQICGNGEFFHPRSKIIVWSPHSEIGGIALIRKEQDVINPESMECLKNLHYPKNEETLKNEFLQRQENAILLDKIF